MQAPVQNGSIRIISKDKSRDSPHPLDPLSTQEVDTVRDIVLKSCRDQPVVFRSISTEEPAKAALVSFLKAEHAGDLSRATKPPRQARAQYDIINDDRTRDYFESVVDIEIQTIVLHRVVDKQHQPALTIDEFRAFQDACMKSPLWEEAIANLQLPDGFEVVIDPW